MVAFDSRFTGDEPLPGSPCSSPTLESPPQAGEAWRGRGSRSMTPIAWKSRAPNALWMMFGRALTGTIRPKRGGRVQLAFLCAAASVLRKHERDGAGAAGHRGSTHRNSTAVLELVSGFLPCPLVPR